MSQRSDVAELTPEQNARLKRAWRRLLLRLPIQAIALVVLMFTIYRLLPHEAGQDPHPLPIGAFWVGVAVAFFVVLPQQYRFLKRRFTQPGPARDLAVLGEPEDILRLAKRLRRGQEIVGADRPLARAYVAVAAKQLRVLPFILGGLGASIAVVFALAARHHQPLPWALLVPAGVLVALFCWIVLSYARAIAHARKQHL